MKGGGYRERAARPKRQKSVPLDRNIGKLPICREGQNGEVAGNKRSPKSAMELKLHPGWFRHAILEVVENGPIVRDHIESDEVPCAVAPRPATCRDGRVGVRPGWGEVLGAGPSGGDIPKTEDLIHFLLLKKETGGVELEHFK